MIELDLRSIIIMNGILGVLLAVVLMFLRLSYPRSVKGLALWAAAPALVAVSSLLLGLRGVIPDLMSVVGANLLLLAGVMLYYFGVQRFFGLGSSHKRWLGILAAALAYLVWFGVVEPSFTARVLLVTGIWIVLFLLSLRLVWRHGKETFSSHFTMAVLVIHLFALLLRFITALLPLPDEGLLDPSRVQTLYIAANAFTIVALNLGLILMASDRLHDEFEHAASHDSLTNVLLRRTLIEACEQEFARCRRHGHSMVLLMLDIDHFKAINDTHGHQVGDRVLVDFVNRISPLLRRFDKLGRFGGEEFVVMLPETSLEEAQIVAQRIRVRVELPGGELPPITVSIGMTSYHSDDADIDALLGRADQALYRAKESGRNRIVTA